MISDIKGVLGKENFSASFASVEVIEVIEGIQNLKFFLLMSFC